MSTRHINRTLFAIAASAALMTGCGNAVKDAANDALKDAGVELSTGGELPSSFPTDVPTPALKLETAIEAGGQFTLRYTSSDPKAEIAAYSKALADAGFTIASEKDDLAGDGKNVTLLATKGTTNVAAAAFASDAPGGGNYMGVVVTGS